MYPHCCTLYRNDRLYQRIAKKAENGFCIWESPRSAVDLELPVGGYCEPEPAYENSAQFDISDTRTLDEVIRWLMEMDYIPSFCTACYREGRTGDRFMSLCKSGKILNCCHPNALMTLQEYLSDYASEETKRLGEALIAKEVEHIPSAKIKEIAKRNLQAIAEGNQRDFRF